MLYPFPHITNYTPVDDIPDEEKCAGPIKHDVYGPFATVYEHVRTSASRPNPPNWRLVAITDGQA